MQKIIKTIKTIFPYLIFITLFSIPFQIRKVLVPVFENGYFHETLSMSIYASDILIILCITCGLLVYYCDILKYLKKKWKNIKGKFSRKLPPPQKNPLLIFPFQRRSPRAEGEIRNPLFWLSLFVLWQCATLFRANDIGIAIFRIVKIIEMTLFGIILYLVFSNTKYLILNTSNNKNKKLGFWFLVSGFGLILSGIIQSLWAILQFILQQSLGLTFLKESVLSPAIPGVAKIIIGGQKYIRAYGGLPHPNILAGFLAVSIVCTIILIFQNRSCRDEAVPRLYTKENSLPPLPPPQAEGEEKLTLLLPNHYTKLTLLSCNHYTKLTLVLKISLIFQIISLILSGSISGFLALVVLGGMLFAGRDGVMPRLYDIGSHPSKNHPLNTTPENLPLLPPSRGGDSFQRRGDSRNEGESKITLLLPACNAMQAERSIAGRPNHYTRPHRYADNSINQLNSDIIVQQDVYNKGTSESKRFGQAKVTLLSCNHYTKLTLVLTILLFLTIPAGLIYLRSGDLLTNKNSVTERIDQYTITGEILSENKNIVFGIGSGNYVNYLKCRDAKFCVSTANTQPWQKQPVHNVFALILVENGGVGLVLFLIFFILLAWQKPLIIGLLPILCLDYYLWTMQQGMLIFVLVIIISIVYENLILEIKKSRDKEIKR